jgi:gliding motility-associated-like protein
VSSDTTTTTITVSPGFNVSLGPDQSICPGDVTVLTPSPAGQSYLWSNNATSPSITVGQSGSYWVQVTNATGCIARDTVTINVINPQLNLGADQTVCAGDTVVLDAGYPGASYLWSNNYNTQTVAVTATADYWVQVTLPLGCILRDTMRATFVPLPFLNIGSDAAICAGESVVLDAGPHPNDALLWSTNATTQLITTSTPGLYWAEVTANPGCTTRDTVLVNLDPTPVVEIGGDTVICQGDSLLLDAGNAGSIFDWNTGVHTQAITVSDAGSYGVTVTNAQGCSATDVRTVTTIQDFAIELGPDTFLCDVNALLLNPGVADLVYQWSTGANTHLITATASGIYWVDVSNACYAHSDSIRLTFSSDSAGPFIPSAFTPNGDGLNDVLRIEGLREDVGFQMRIFDRWGMMVYESTDPMAGWDGKFHGVAAQEGVYALLVQVTDCRGKLQPVVGSVSLMR